MHAAQPIAMEQLDTSFRGQGCVKGLNIRASLEERLFGLEGFGTSLGGFKVETCGVGFGELGV